MNMGVAHHDQSTMAELPENNPPSAGPRGAAGILYGLTIFVGAFLLFQVEPIIAKIILPWFGGASAVWTTCLLFFQVVLLLGYLYAHWIINHFRPQTQTRLHLGLLALGIILLPIMPRDAWKPLGSETPSLHILLLLSATVGVPYFLLSATSPLLQAWYAQGRRGAQPYRFFALSNAGSMLALLTYPAGVEPFFSTRHQAMGWSLAFAGFAVLSATLALRPRGAAEPRNLAPSTPRPTASLQVLWVSLAACGSTFLLAITNQLSQNVAAIPFMWILPLSLYLLSFILCFEGRGWYWRDLFLRLMAVALGGMAYVLSSNYTNLPLYVLIPLFSAGLFLCCMVCHGELARLKPAPEHLTSFYLMIAMGGAVGGIFVAGIAPYVFPGFFELDIAMVSCAVLVLVVLRRDSSSTFYQARWQPAWLMMVLLSILLAGFLVVQIRRTVTGSTLMVRNFYGSLRVIDQDTSDPDDATRQLMNGTITHGKEFLFPDRRMEPTTYYGPDSGAGLALRVVARHGPLHAGVIGLGAGTLAAYGRPGDRYSFYDINPLVIELAHSQFYFLKGSKAQIEIVPGDARLSLERQPKQDFDVLAVDAFSGDAIPIHLLTREAFVLYFRHLNPGGVLAVHVSNRYVDLKPVVQRVAQSLRKLVYAVDSSADEDKEIFKARWVLVSDRQEFFDEPQIKAAIKPLPARADFPLWTDDYSSLWKILK